MSVPEFPNWFMITGPMGCFANLPPVIDTQVQWIAQAINSTGDADSTAKGGDPLGKKTFEARQQAEDDWLEGCYKLATGTLFTESPS